MRALRRFFKRLSSWATTRQDEERLRAEIEEHLALANSGECSRRFVAGRSATSGRAEVRRRGSHQGKLSGPERTAVSGNADAGYAPGAATLANGPGVHHRHGADTGAGHWRDHLDFHVGACRSAEVAAGRESRRTVPPGQRSTLLLLGRVQSGQGVLPCLVRSCTNTLRDNTKGFSELAAFPAVGARCSASGARAARRQPRAIRASSSPAITSPCSASRRVCRTRAYSRGRSAPALRRSP